MIHPGLQYRGEGEGVLQRDVIEGEREAPHCDPREEIGIRGGGGEESPHHDKWDRPHEEP